MKAIFSLLCVGLLAFAFSACTTPGTTTKPAAAVQPKPAAPSTPVVTTPARPTTPTPATPVVTTPVRPVSPTPAGAFTPIRIKAGESAAFTDSKGVKWDADTNYIDGGSTINRPTLTVTNTDNPDIFHSEHYQKDNIHIKVPNGTYTLKLYFSEDYDGNTSADARLFDWVVKDGTPTAGKVVKEYKNWGPWKASGAFGKAQVETIKVTVTNGQISIVFTAIAENPQINAIEVLAG